MTLPDSIAGLKSPISSNLNNNDQSFWWKLSVEIGSELTTYQARQDDMRSNTCWFLKTTCEVRGFFIRSINTIKNGEFYEGWCELERVELLLMALQRNPFLDVGEFKVLDLLQLVHEWQKAYPYKCFVSPAILYKTVQCGICFANVTPWSHCEHEAGIVYGGVCCHRVIVDAELVHLALVPDPVQKYSAIHMRKDEHGQDVEIYDYATVQFIAERVASPFDRFRINWTKAFHPHELFSDRAKEGPCPCQSGRSYAGCCWQTQGVLRPHMQVSFEKEPASNLSNAELVGYGDEIGPAALTREL